MLALLTLLIAVAPADSTDTPSAAALHRAVDAYTLPFDRAPAKTQRQIAFADLNGDGLKDALVRLEGVDWCGSDGCALLVFEAIDGEDAEEWGPYRIAAEISMVSGAVGVADAGAGWSDLVVHDAEGTARRLAFDGETYPMSPTEGTPWSGTGWTVLMGG